MNKVVDKAPVINIIMFLLGCCQVVRQRTLTPLFVGSNPTIPVSNIKKKQKIHYIHIKFLCIYN